MHGTPPSCVNITIILVVSVNIRVLMIDELKVLCFSGQCSG